MLHTHSKCCQLLCRCLFTCYCVGAVPYCTQGVLPATVQMSVYLLLCRCSTILHTGSAASYCADVWGSNARSVSVSTQCCSSCYKSQWPGMAGFLNIFGGFLLPICFHSHFYIFLFRLTIKWSKYLVQVSVELNDIGYYCMPILIVDIWLSFL